MSINVKTEGNKTIITIDNDSELRPSSSGKMDLLATTGGFLVTDSKSKDGRQIKINCTVGVANAQTS